MKKSAFLLMMSIASLILVPNQLHAASNMPAIENAESAARAEVLVNRLNEIKEMDKSEMTRAEKKELRKEVKAIKSELKATGNGVYLSVGAIIIIILLLILLL
jgi:hypothetical protein